MTKIQRIENFALALLMVFFAFVLVIDPEDEYSIILGLISLSWLLQSVRLLIYYFTMARFMVDGKRVLLKGAIFFDLAIVTSYLDTVPNIYIMIYLVAGMVFFNLIEILRAVDAKKCGSRHWRLKLLAGLFGIILALACLCSYSTPSIAGDIYAVELIYAALIKVINSVRRTEIVYIQ